MINQVAHKIIGYFAYSPTGNVFCDGDACIVAGTEELIHSYQINMILNYKEQDIVKKTKFGEIMEGLGHGAAYAFDKEAYVRFFPLARQCGLEELPAPDNFFLQKLTAGMHFIRIQVGRCG